MENKLKNSYRKLGISTLTIGMLLISYPVYSSTDRKEETKAIAPTQEIDNYIEYRNSFEQLSKEMDRLMIRHNGPGMAALITNNSFNSYLDVNDKEYTINIEIPGFDKQQITIELQGDYLVIKGQKSQDKDNKKNDNSYADQQYRNSFYQKLLLPKDINKDSISSSLKNGVLTVILPKAPVKAEEVKKIPIN